MSEHGFPFRVAYVDCVLVGCRASIERSGRPSSTTQIWCTDTGVSIDRCPTDAQVPIDVTCRTELVEPGDTGIDPPPMMDTMNDMANGVVCPKGLNDGLALLIDQHRSIIVRADGHLIDITMMF